MTRSGMSYPSGTDRERRPGAHPRRAGARCVSTAGRARFVYWPSAIRLALPECPGFSRRREPPAGTSRPFSLLAGRADDRPTRPTLTAQPSLALLRRGAVTMYRIPGAYSRKSTTSAPAVTPVRPTRDPPPDSAQAPGDGRASDPTLGLSENRERIAAGLNDVVVRGAAAARTSRPRCCSSQVTPRAARSPTPWMSWTRPSGISRSSAPESARVDRRSGQRTSGEVAHGGSAAPRGSRRWRVRRPPATRALAGADAEVTLVDRTNHHLFQPLLYQVAAGILPPGLIAPALRQVVRSQPNVRVLLADVQDIDLDRRMCPRDGAGRQVHRSAV